MTTAQDRTDVHELTSDVARMQMCSCRHELGAHLDHGACRMTGCECEAFERIYSSADMHHLTGASYRQITYWTKCGLLDDNRRGIEPKGADRWHVGSGHPLWFTAHQLDVVNLAVALVKWGLVPSRALEEAHRAVEADESRAVLPNTAWQVQIVLVTVAMTAPDPTPEEATP